MKDLVAFAKRAAIAADIPTTHENGVAGYETGAWFGFLPPTDTPPAAVDRINAETNRALKLSAARERLVGLGCKSADGTSAAFAAFLRHEADECGKVIRSAGIRLD